MTAQVLVVEDDPDIRDAVVDVFKTETPWIEVSSASDGMEALELLEGGAEPRLALLDVMMPVMNGVEFLDALRDRNLVPAMQVVLVSAHVQFARHVTYPRISVLLPKPFRATDLLAIVRQHCPDPSGSRAESGAGLPSAPLRQLASPRFAAGRVTPSQAWGAAANSAHRRTMGALAASGLAARRSFSCGARKAAARVATLSQSPPPTLWCPMGSGT